MSASHHSMLGEVPFDRILAAVIDTGLILSSCRVFKSKKKPRGWISGVPGNMGGVLTRFASYRAYLRSVYPSHPLPKTPLRSLLAFTSSTAHAGLCCGTSFKRMGYSHRWEKCGLYRIRACYNNFKVRSSICSFVLVVGIWRRCRRLAE